MASIRPPFSISYIPFHMLFYSSCRVLSRSRTHSQTSFVVFRFMVSLAAFRLSLSFTLPPPASPLILHSASLLVPLYLTCLMISQELFGPHEREPPLFSSTTNLQTGTLRIPEDERWLTRIRGRHVVSSEMHPQKHVSSSQTWRVPVLNKCERVRSRVTILWTCELAVKIPDRTIRDRSKVEMVVRKNWLSEGNPSALDISRISRIRRCFPILSQYFRKFSI